MDRGVPLAALLVVALAACVSPVSGWWQHVGDAGFRSTIVAGDPFRHVILDKPGTGSRTLHVYLDGDGTPWKGGRPAADPTPRNPLVLDLMRLDPAPSIYLGRPCYHGLAGDPGCVPSLWTDERYSERVVSSMAAALARHLRTQKSDRVAFIGYSGGGTLGVLLASRAQHTAAVVTVAANLDIDAWTARHGYRHLAGSLNPASQPPLPSRLYQRHYVGERDQNVPPDIVARGPLAASAIVIVPDFDHVCCWRRLWPSVVTDLTRATGAR